MYYRFSATMLAIDVRWSGLIFIVIFFMIMFECPAGPGATQMWYNWPTLA